MAASIGPLTTTFTPPASCATHTNLTWVTWATDQTFVYQGPMPRQDECYPSNYEFRTGDFYSPGVCPSGYTAACSNLNSIGTVTETIQTCCPQVGDWECLEPGSVTLEWQETMACTWLFGRDTIIRDMTVVDYNRSTSQEDKTFDAHYGANAFGIVVRSQEGDMVSSSTTSDGGSATSPTATNGNRPTTIPSTETPAAQADDEEGGDSDSGGLGGGAIAGIVVGCVAAVVIACVAGWFLWRRRRRQQALAGHHGAPAELPSTMADTTRGTGAEADGGGGGGGGGGGVSGMMYKYPGTGTAGGDGPPLVPRHKVELHAEQPVSYEMPGDSTR